MTTRKIWWVLYAAMSVGNTAYAAADIGAPDADHAIVSLPERGVPISRPSTRACRVDIIKNYPFDAFGKISEQPYVMPKDCPGPWAKVVLDMEGAIDGAQYDRFGFIHLGQVELLRFTTPEPPHHAIHWHVEKDVTAYSSVFAAPEVENFTVQLDNSISKKLNGVYRLTAFLTFYMPNKEFPAAAHPNFIKTISSGDNKQPYFSLVSPTTLEAASTLALPTNITRAVLEVYATPHDQEEFWYLPGGNVAPYRELRIFIDGKLAGVAWPFPYIYTGGFNPHYWTPIAAIDALNIPPYHVDLTPFAAMLNKSDSAGNKHRISISLNVMPSNWLIDANLLLDTDPKLKTVTGQMSECNISPDATVTTLNHSSDSAKFKDNKITRSLRCTGVIKTSQGNVITMLEQQFTLKNEFPFAANRSPGFEHLLSQDLSTRVTTKHSLKIQAKATQTSYTFRISPSVDDMNSNLPAPFALDQSLQSIVKTINNGISRIESVTSQRINSANLTTQDSEQTKKNNYVSTATSIFRSNGKCYYLKLQATDNKLILQTIQDNPNSSAVISPSLNFNETCH
jgi:hypothetical protein